MRLRNPWGAVEWNGSWSDNSSEWNEIPQHVKEQIGLTIDDDGEFWMNFVDWVYHFDLIEICNLCPTPLTEDQITERKKRWERMRW